jgi:large subunit ribosomal protein L25
MLREETGTLRMRRMRSAGRIPAVLFGHGENCVNLAIDAREVQSLVKHGSHFVELKGAVNEHAMVADVQWDGLGSEVLHLDLLRIDVTESVELDLAIELKGQAPGTKAGGILNFVLHEVTVRGPANKLPDRLELRIGNLELNQWLNAKDIPLPEGVELVTDPEEMVVECQLPKVEAEAPAATADFTSEPEVIGRKEEEGAESEAE